MNNARNTSGCWEIQGAVLSVPDLGGDVINASKESSFFGFGVPAKWREPSPEPILDARDREQHCWLVRSRQGRMTQRGPGASDYPPRLGSALAAGMAGAAIRNGSGERRCKIS